MNNRGAKLLVLIVVAGLAIVIWFFRDDLMPATDEIVVVEPEPVNSQAPARNAPLYPVSPPEPIESVEPRAHRP